MANVAKKEPQTYRQALAEAEKILEQIESNALDVDQMADAVKEALALLAFCKAKLRTTEEDIEKLMGE